jgi:hypothetical protein
VLHTTSPSDWYNEFLRQSQQTSQSPTIQGVFRRGAIIADLEYSGASSSSLFHAQTSQEFTATEIFDEPAFEAAFAEARAEVEMLENELSQQDETTVSGEIVDTVRIGSDTIAPQLDGVDESDELAKTAGQLLDSVRHDQSQKFKESNFLALMRQLRDREVTVEGDEFRQVSTLP